MSCATKRARTSESGACSYCVKLRERCYVGVKGVPCTSCRRSNRVCDALSNLTIPSKKPRPMGSHCAEGLFASQIQEIQLVGSPRSRIVPAIGTTDPLDNYISIAHQLLGPGPPDSPISIDLPDYVAELPDRLDPSDLQYLDLKGAFCLPTPQFRSQLLKSYILYVHPHVPVLDLESFLRTIADNDGHASISLLLFHAVMFAASSFVDLKHIYNEGYASRKAARGVLFQRVKALLELDCEDDRLATVQALLLLIHWSDVRDGDKDASHWMGICLSLATSIGLHKNPDSTIMTIPQQQIWRRTWWSVYNHARLTAVDLLTMMTFDEDYNNIEEASDNNGMVTLDHFRFGVFSPEARRVVADDCEVLRIVEYQKAQALVFIEKTRLCRLSQFSSFSSEVARLVLGRAIPDTKVCTKDDDDNDSSLQISPSKEKDELQEWLEQLPSAVRHQYPVVLTPTTWQRSIYLHRIWLKLLYIGSSYYAVNCNGSHNLNLRRGSSLTSSGSRDRDLLTSYLCEVTELVDEVETLDLAQNLPTPATALLVLVLAFHRREIDVGTPSTQSTSARKLHRCWNVIRKLSETSELAKSVVALAGRDDGADLWERLSSTLLL